MARGYSEQFLRELFADEPAELSKLLGKQSVGPDESRADATDDGGGSTEMADPASPTDGSGESSSEEQSRPTITLQSSHPEPTSESNNISSLPVGERIGVQLAKTCVRANLPMTYVAKPLGVSKLTVFHWFHGKPVRPKYHELIGAFITVVERDTRDGLLPALNNKAAKTYIDMLLSDEG